MLQKVLKRGERECFIESRNEGESASGREVVLQSLESRKRECFRV